MFIDSHAHFVCSEGAEIGPCIDRAVIAGVSAIIAVGGSDELNRGALEAARIAPEHIRTTLGYDRDQAPALASTEDAASELANRLVSEIDGAGQAGIPVVAVGEIGIDLYYTPDSVDPQLRLFRTQLEIARRCGLPIIVHSREADEETLTCLREHANAWQGSSDRLGVLHCFTGSSGFASELLALGYHISFSGIVTFRNADPLRQVAKSVPTNRLLIETDSPYLAPVPLRGKRNEPAYLRYVAETLASVRGCDLDDIARITSQNARRLFGVGETVHGG